MGVWQPPTLLSPHSLLGTLGPQATFAGVFSGGIGAAVWPAAERVLLVPVRVRDPLLVQTLGWFNGSTVNGNVDAGVYTLDGARLVATGATAMSGANVLQSASVTNTMIGPGCYYLALWSSSGTATFNRQAPANVQYAQWLGCCQSDSSGSLGATLTLASIASAYLPVIWAGVAA